MPIANKFGFKTNDNKCLCASLFAVLALFVFFIINFKTEISGDTVILINTARNINNILTNTNLAAIHFPMGQLVNFPVSQYIPALIFIKFNLLDQDILAALSRLNLLSFFFIMLFFMLFFKEKQNIFIALFHICIFVTGYAIWFAESTFNEMAASFLILLFVFSCLKKMHYIVTILLFVLSGITKEIAPPLLFIFGLVAFYDIRERCFRKYCKNIIVLIIGFLISVMINCATNWLQYGVFYNKALAIPIFIVPGIKQWIKNYLGLFFSPNGGLFFYWFSFSMYVLILSIIIIKRALIIVRNISLQKGAAYSAPLIIVLSCLLVLNLGLARWWAPFGWLCWGPRLTYPYLPCMMLLLGHYYRREIIRVIILFTSNLERAILTGIVFALIALPSFFAYIDYDKVIGHYIPLVSNPACHNPDTNVELYYRGINEVMWIQKSILLRCFDMLNDNTILIKSIIFITIIVCMFVFIYLLNPVYSRNKGKLKISQNIHL